MFLDFNKILRITPGQTNDSALLKLWVISNQLLFELWKEFIVEYTF